MVHGLKVFIVERQREREKGREVEGSCGHVERGGKEEGNRRGEGEPRGKRQGESKCLRERGEAE